MSFSLLDAFRKQAEQASYTIDPIQQQAIQHLSHLAAALCAPQKHQKPASFYIWGPVGRGKSWLLNTLFETIPLTQKKRFHFHVFFKLLHQQMFQQSAQQDALQASLDLLLNDCKLLCFDEFHIHDIADAMLIKRLFESLFKRNIALVTTSNYPPQELLPNPLYHERFLPAIKLIEKHMTLLPIAGSIDYRTLPQLSKQGYTAGYYIFPSTPAQRKQLKLPSYSKTTVKLAVGNRVLQAIQHEQRTVMFNFEDLCESNTAVMDYLILAEQFDIWILDNLPPLGTTSIGAQQRFINLIDILYDQNKCLYLLAQHSIADTLANTAIGDMMRTESRLKQLQKC